MFSVPYVVRHLSILCTIGARRYAMLACILLALPGLIYEQVTRQGQRLVHGLAYDLVQLLLTG